MAVLRFLHETLNVSSLDLICVHHLSGHGAAHDVTQCRLVRPTGGEHLRGCIFAAACLGRTARRRRWLDWVRRLTTFSTPTPGW